MKLPLAFIFGSSMLLAACQSGPSLGANGSAELANIRHVCILARPAAKDPNPELKGEIAAALNKYGISSEAVDTDAGRQRLYESDCRYNLRYNTNGRGNSINYISLLIRTPEHSVASLRAYPNFTAGGRQAEIDRIIGQLLNKK
ncbi:Uncharacterised protein [Kingella potus]|uniref:Lipoprotein n=1 Tax=Kingella potus TaxID=265175 RepID=A0A377R5K0_9NEIS|nr:hypothetical protein [Kingella potus]STR02825.1 Uncharacterised protein [Kingella potus]